MKLSRTCYFAVAASALLLAGGSAAQSSYPNKPIRMIVPFAAGGSTDNIARTMAQKMGEQLGQPVIVDNRPGGNAIIGSEALTKSPPDGYTIMMTSVDHTVIPQLLPTPYDPVKDFVPVGAVSFTQLLLVVNPSVQANNLQELIALAKASPGKLNYASSGSGCVPHLTGEMLSKQTGIAMQHIPYKGGGPAMIDLVGGQVQLTFAIPINAIPHIKSGKLRPIAITGATRNEALPQVPTFTEAGVPGLDVKTWFAVFAPVGTPKPIVDRLSESIRKALAMPDVKEKLAGQGMEPYVTTPEEFAEIVKADFAKYGRVIKEGNIKIE
jgi:tripartite-type tricarboxylate transporter receptor subunit TctC